MMRTIESLEQELAIAYKNIKHQQEWRDNLSHELKRTKRALWLARAERAKDICDMADVCVSALEANKVQKVWQPIANKCRQYADKFKEDK